MRFALTSNFDLTERDIQGHQEMAFLNLNFPSLEQLTNIRDLESIALIGFGTRRRSARSGLTKPEHILVRRELGRTGFEGQSR